jgi:DNA-nicking Smr family endonuclease
MARGKKKRRGEADASAQRPKSFDFKPFLELKKEKAPPPAALPQKVEPEPPPKTTVPQSDDDAFAAMVAGAAPLTGVAPLAPQRVGPRPGPPPADDAAAVMRELDDLVSGVAPFDFADTEEFVEASVRGLDRRVLRQLRRGDFSFQAHLDLHGMRREEARAKVAEFVTKAHAEGKKCVLIVHGRGLGSKDNIPVLKEKLTAWLTRGAIGKRVLAFTSARPYDGGTGAVYVLLRG